MKGRNSWSTLLFITLNHHFFPPRAHTTLLMMMVHLKSVEAALAFRDGLRSFGLIHIQLNWFCTLKCVIPLNDC